MILASRVRVNGIVVNQLGYKVHPDDEVMVDDQHIGKADKITYVINKPKNVISSASDDRGRITVVDLIESPERVYPIGRLDYDSSGLLLLSNDGDLTNMIIHPRFHIPKVYEVTIDGNVADEVLQKMAQGIMVDDYMSAPCNIERIKDNKKTSLLKMTLYEGHNRQIRKMFASVGFKVVKLHRIAEANITLGHLRSGEYRQLKPYEIKKLKEYLNGGNR